MSSLTMDPRISVVSSIVEIPIITGALYAFDIDDTLLELVRVWSEHGVVNPGEHGVVNPAHLRVFLPSQWLITTL